MRDFNHPSVFGKGCFGIGIYKASHHNTQTKEYNIWIKMLERCYSTECQNKYPSYIGCIVSEEWLNFQVFAQWYHENKVEKYQLDKDILVKGNKIYSPLTCCFVPQEINLLFTKKNTNRGIFPIGVNSYKYKETPERYRATLSRNGRIVTLGRYNTIEEAFQIYKQAKEQYIKQIADKYKSTISQHCYEAMYKYIVEITD